MAKIPKISERLSRDFAETLRKGISGKGSEGISGKVWEN